MPEVHAHVIIDIILPPCMEGVLFILRGCGISMQLYTTSGRPAAVTLSASLAVLTTVT